MRHGDPRGIARSRALAGAFALVTCALVSLGSGTAGAQESGIIPPQDAPVPPGPRSVQGRVMRPLVSGPVPVPGTMVTLHRVGRDSAGALDSALTGTDGRYRFSYRASGSGDAVYFTSTRYGGIAYFTAPLRAREVTGDDAEIAVFDTTSRPIPLHLQGRHLVLGAPGADGTRPVIEVFEMSNDTVVTRIAAGDTGATWTARLPAAALNARAREGDITPDAVAIANGEVRVVAPFAPGLKQLVIAYDLPPAAFPFTIPAGERTGVMEVLIEDTVSTVSGGRLEAQGAVSIEGRQFRRWLGNDVPRGESAVITVPNAALPARALWLPALLGGTVLLLAFAFVRARSGAILVPQAPSPRVTRLPDEHERLAREIATLDLAQTSSPAALGAGEYQRQRAALEARLVAALAAAGQPG